MRAGEARHREIKCDEKMVVFKIFEIDGNADSNTRQTETEKTLALTLKNVYAYVTW